jgi:DNA-binding NtrC family response regulator
MMTVKVKILSRGLSMAAPETTSRPKRILVVDQDEWNRDFLASVIKMLGAELRLASSAKEASETMEETTFDLVITDLKLPESRHLLVHIKNRFPGLPLICMACQRSQMAQLNMLDHPFDIVAKPAKFDEIIRKIRNAMHRMDLKETEDEFRRLKREAFRLFME